MRALKTLFASVDIWLIGAVFLLSLLGLVTMYTFDGDNTYFDKQLFWIGIASVALVLAIIPDYRFCAQGIPRSLCIFVHSFFSYLSFLWEKR